MPNITHQKDIVLLERLKVIQHNMKTAMISVIMLIAICIYFASNFYTSYALAGWGTYGLIVALANGLYAIYSKRRVVNSSSEIKNQLNTFLIFALLSGIIWALPILAFDGQLILSSDGAGIFLYFLVISCGLTASSIGSNAVYRPMYYVFIAPFMLSLIYKITEVSFLDPSYWGILPLTVLFLLSTLSYAYTYSRNFEEVLLLKDNNRLLAEKFKLEKEKAEFSDKAKSTFLASASHDLRQPLQALGLYTELLNNEQEPTKVQHLTSKIRKSSDDLRLMLDGLLDLSKLQAGGVATEIKPFSLQHVFSELEQTYKVEANNKNLDLTFITSSLWINSDIFLVKRILSNLITNAIRYTQQGKIIIGVRRQKDKAVIQVLDTGIGIDQKNLCLIFNEYYQVSNQERDRTQGLGLGLSITQGLAQTLNTEILAHSKIDKGSCFSFELPTCEEELIPAKKAPNYKHTLQNIRVLIIDDDNEILDATLLLLDQWGFQAKGVSNIQQSLDLIKNDFLPDVVITDFRLRDNETGVKLINKLKLVLTPEPVFIIITGETDPDNLIQVNESGATILNKPIQPALMRLTIVQQHKNRLNQIAINN